MMETPWWIRNFVDQFCLSVRTAGFDLFEARYSGVYRGTCSVCDVWHKDNLILCAYTPLNSAPRIVTGCSVECLVINFLQRVMWLGHVAGL